MALYAFDGTWNVDETSDQWVGNLASEWYPKTPLLVSCLQGERDANRFVNGGQFFVTQGIDSRSQS